MADERASWDNDKREFLLELLLEQTALGKRCDGGNGWKKEAWQVVMNSLNEKFEVKLNTKQMKECFNNLKKEYQLVKELRNLSGFGWNSEAQMVTAKADVWDAYLAEHKDAKRFRGKIWPFWDAMHQLLDGRIPTGKEKLYPTMNGIPSIVIY
jgi:hypothetical protein